MIPFIFFFSMTREYNEISSCAIVRLKQNRPGPCGSKRRRQLKAYAKINIGLKIMGKRADGFHNLDTYFHLVELSDDLSFTLVKNTAETEVSIKGNEEYLPRGATDLMEKATFLFSLATGISFHLDINIKKNIPFQAGLGGGSSDAASVLKFLNDEYDNLLSKDELQSLALDVGSDVPFFLCGSPAAHGQGRGEILSPIAPASYPILIIHRRKDKVSTGEAFRKADERKTRPEPLAPWKPEASYWKENYTNDFDFLQPLLKDLAILPLLETSLWHSTSGSGSSHVLVYENEEERSKALRCLEKAQIDLVVIESFLKTWL